MQGSNERNRHYQMNYCRCVYCGSPRSWRECDCALAVRAKEVRQVPKDKKHPHCPGKYNPDNDICVVCFAHICPHLPTDEGGDEGDGTQNQV